jgi:hypothetical protein
VAALGDTLAGIAIAQQTYVAPGSHDPSFDRMSLLVRQLYDGTAALAGRLRSAQSTRVLASLAAATESLIAADTQARENLRRGQTLMAADVIWSDSRSTLDGMADDLRRLRTAENAVYDEARASFEQARWTVLAATAVWWLLVAALLTPRPAAASAAPAVSNVAPEGLRLANATRAPAAPAVESGNEPSTGIPAPSPPVDLTAVAALCTELSRVAAAPALERLVERAATILDASGLILWMSAGEELFPVTAHGYPRQVIARLGPIGRAADNATAAAWRTGAVTTVTGDAGGPGAIVAPMFGPDACIGVLAVELPRRREQDAAVRAAAQLVAAQLATAVSAWPAASVSRDADAPGHLTGEVAREFRSAGR